MSSKREFATYLPVYADTQRDVELNEDLAQRIVDAKSRSRGQELRPGLPRPANPHPDPASFGRAGRLQLFTGEDSYVRDDLGQRKQWSGSRSRHKLRSLFDGFERQQQRWMGRSKQLVGALCYHWGCYRRGDASWVRTVEVR